VNAFREQTSLSADFIQKNCSSNECPLECDSTNYGTSISISQYPTSSYEARLENFYAGYAITSDEYSGYLGDNILQLKIYYDSLAYTSIEESISMDIITLLANIGGIAGLFLGCSVLTIVEGLELILTLIYNIRANNRKIKDKNETSF
jgi:hypothetical protein